MNDVQRHPIDYEALQKGDVIPIERIEQITSTKRGTAAYQLAILQLRNRIERELHDRAKDWTVRCVKGTLRVLTDAEASPYNHQEQQKARKAMLRRFHLNNAVDVRQLDDDQRHAHERVMEIDGKYVQALATARKELQLESHKRKTPALPA